MAYSRPSSNSRSGGPPAELGRVDFQDRGQFPMIPNRRRSPLARPGSYTPGRSRRRGPAAPGAFSRAGYWSMRERDGGLPTALGLLTFAEGSWLDLAMTSAGSLRVPFSGPGTIKPSMLRFDVMNGTHRVEDLKARSKQHCVEFVVRSPILIGNFQIRPERPAANKRNRA